MKNKDMRPVISFSWLKRGLADSFLAVPVKSEQIQIIRGPSEFFETIKKLTSRSQSRITWSALYFGIKNQEEELISILKRRIRDESKLNVTLLFDYTRGTRQEKLGGRLCSSVDLLRNVITGDNVKISFYLSPLFSMNWFRRNLLFPKQKQNEIVELQHMKCFIFDDDIVISGANLSESYFSNRDDRYILIKNCPELSDYFHDVIQATSSFSLKMSSDGSLAMDQTSFKHHPLDRSSYAEFVEDARSKIQKVQRHHASEHNLILDDKLDTIVIPLLQFPTYGIKEERKFMNHLLSNVPSHSVMKLASGYFNLTSEYIDALLSNRSKFESIDLLVASEKVNSFYKAKGLIGRIPSVYTTFSSSFFEKIARLSDENPVRMYLFERSKWTFHTKGLWMHLNRGTKEESMMVTIGSSNFGYRSSYKDLENQVVLITKNDELISRFTEEYKYFWSFGRLVTSLNDFPHVPSWVRFVSKFIKGYF